MQIQKFNLIDARLRLVFTPQGNYARKIENCGKNAVSVSVSKDTSGVFLCPLMGEVEVQNMQCLHNCDQRRRV